MTKDRWRMAALAGLFAAGIALAAGLSVGGVSTPLPPTLAPAFQLMGTPVKSLDHLVTKVMPVGEVDERDLGEVLRAQYEARADPTDPTFIYLNDLVQHLAAGAKKPFVYRAYLLNWTVPNAMALPGGVILVTAGLLDVMQSEAELVSVLGHEMGHIEQGHCLDAVKFQLVAQKVGERTLGQIVDFALVALTSHAFSKTQEAEADEYGYAALLNSPYDPRGAGGAFASLEGYQQREGGSAGARTAEANPLRDYFMSHPPLAIRRALYSERAEAWWRRHRGETRVLGEDNLRQRVTVFAAEQVRPAAQEPPPARP